MAFFMNLGAGRKHKLALRLPALQRGETVYCPCLAVSGNRLLMERKSVLG